MMGVLEYSFIHLPFIYAMVIIFYLQHGRLLLLHIVGELETDAVDAVSLIGRGIVSLALEDMTQMATTVSAQNLGARHSQRAILMADDSTGNRVKVGGPAAAAVELVRGLVQRRIAARAVVHALLGEVRVVLAGAGALSALKAQNAELL